MGGSGDTKWVPGLFAEGAPPSPDGRRRKSVNRWEGAGCSGGLG